MVSYKQCMVLLNAKCLKNVFKKIKNLLILNLRFLGYNIPFEIHLIIGFIVTILIILLNKYLMNPFASSPKNNYDFILCIDFKAKPVIIRIN